MLERVVGWVADAVIVSQPDVAERFGSEAILILNAPVVQGTLIEKARAFGPTLSEAEVHPNGAARLAYIGGIGRARGLFTMIELLEELNRRQPTRLWLLGHSDSEDLSEATARDGWKHVDFLGLRPQHEAFGYVARSDVALALLLDEGGHADASPNKRYEYMALATPFVASDYDFWREGLPEDAGGSFVYPSAVAWPQSAIRSLLVTRSSSHPMARRGRG